MARIVDITNPLTGQPAKVDQLDHTAQEIDDAIARALPGGAIDTNLSKMVPLAGNVIRTGITGGTLGGGCASIVGTENGAYLECFTSLDDYALKRSQLILHPPSGGGPLVALAQTLDGGKSWTSKMLATATPPQEYDLPITDSYDGTLYHRKYCKTQEGIIFLRFAVCKKVGYVEKGDVIGVLPDGYRPSGNVVAIVGVDGIAAGTGIFSAEIQIDPSGQIYVFHVNDKATWIFGTLSFVQG